MTEAVRSFTLFLLLLLILPSLAVNLPNCHTFDFFQVLPLVPQESFIMDFSSLFGGYNLDFNLSSDPDIQKYLKKGQKIKKNGEQFPDVPLTGLKSYQLSKKGNAWGQQFVALTEKGDRTLVHSGFLNSNQTVPVINYFITVENMTNTTCFDAVQLAASNLIVVDCVQRRTSKDSKGRIYKNLFYYFRINDGSKVKELSTEMYVPFQTIAKRKLLPYSDLDSSHTFLLRAYYADGMTDSTQDNTYLEVLMMEDPLSPWVVGLIDRTFLGVPKLRMADAKVYLGQIFILDQAKGVHRIYISGSQDLHYQGCYEARGFKKLAVFSPNLDNRIELAIANSHAVHEVDWTNLEQPLLLNKYSLLPDSTIYQVLLNQRFLFVHSSTTDSSNTLNYTWTFTRGGRSFSRAFAVMQHGSDNAIVDFNEQFSFLMVLNSESITNYAYDDPSFTLKLEQNQSFKDKIRQFTISATSWDPISPDLNTTCSITVNFTLLDQYNRTMWIVGRGPPTQFTANYPGNIKLELGQYVLGPNVTYRLRQTKKGQLSKAKVYQQQQLNVSWTKIPQFGNTTFLKTETFSGAMEDSLMIYSQDESNRTFISKCMPHHQLINVSCSLVDIKNLEGQISNWGTSMVMEPASQQDHHVLAYTTAAYYNKIFLEDLTTGKQVDELNLGDGFPGNISSLSISGKYMFTVLRHIKRVNIYSLQDCLDDNCFPICSLNHLNMYKLGLKYFAPRAVHSSLFHPDLIFVKTDDLILAVDLSKQCVPKILATLHPVESVKTIFNFQVNANFLIVTIQPDIVQQYDLSRIYLKQVRMTKRYPLYGNKLPANYDFEISDYGNCVYLSTLTEGGDYNVFVYRSGLPAVGSLYNQFDLFAFQHVLIDASGYEVDYVTVVSGKELRIFRQYERPEGEINNPKEDYSFYLEYFNTLDGAQLTLIKVSIINLPTYILVNPFLNDIMNTKNLLYSGQNRVNQINDTDWYQGNVLYIKASCSDCDKVKVNNHIQLEEREKVVPSLSSYAYSPKGGSLLTQTSLLNYNTNGSFSQISTLHQNRKRQCKQITVQNYFTVVGCKQDGLIYLQAISHVATKNLVFQPQQTSALGIVRLQISNQLVMVVDAEEDCYRRTRKGGVFLYEISEDLENSEPLVEIQYIDGDDFAMQELGDIYINNAELVYTKEKSIYRLYATEMKRGILIMEFQHIEGKSDIVVRRTYFAEIKSALVGLGETLPYDATFQAVTLISSTRNNQAKLITDRLLVTTGRYHTIQVALTFDFNSNFISKTIEKLYLRYSYYEISNEIKQVGELFLVRQSLPIEFQSSTMNSQLYTVYSIAGDFKGTVQKKGLIGALPLAENVSHSFDFNRTVVNDDGHSVPRVGVIIVEQKGELIKASIHQNLSVVTSDFLDTQIIYLDLINDFSLEKIRILLNGRAPFPEWKLITIILFSIIGLFLLIGIFVTLFKRWKQSRGAFASEERETLITEAAET